MAALDVYLSIGSEGVRVAALVIFWLFVLVIGFHVVTTIWRLVLRPAKNLRKEYGSWAVVTGCTDGIGEAISHEMARKGMNILLISRTQAKLNSVAKAIGEKYPVEIKTLAIDFATYDSAIYSQIKEAVTELEVGVLVNNVGVAHPTDYFAKTSDSDIEAIIQVNIRSLFFVTKCVLPQMIQRRRGAIVNVSSISGISTTPLISTYAASKACIDWFSRNLHYEYNNRGIFVQSLTPSFVATKMSRISDSSVFFPSAERYARHAVATIGYDVSTTGYWVHDIQKLMSILSPEFFYARTAQNILLAKNKDSITESSTLINQRH